VSQHPKKAFPLRIDQALFDAVERLAAAELRSVNAEIEFLLRRGLERRGIKLAPPVKRKRGRPPGTIENEETSDD
jgi:hypothetical protein